jgi:CRP-like cAMP-binding protein
MHQCKNVFEPANSRLPRPGTKSLPAIVLPPITSTDEPKLKDEGSHDIKDYISRIHSLHSKDPYDMKMSDRVKAIQCLLETLPFERSVEDNKSLYHHLMRIEQLACQVSSELLERLSTVACRDSLAGSGYQVLGANAFYIILQGSVVATSSSRAITNLLAKHQLSSKTDMTVLGPGKCFGSLPVTGRTTSTRFLSVVTREPCLFLKIAATDFKRVVEQLKARKYEDKLHLLQSCHLGTQWPRQSINETANLLTWRRAKPNEVICKEGHMAPFIGFIHSGECCVMRQVSGQSLSSLEEHHVRNVEMGKLSSGDFFGHMSLINKQPMKYSVVARSRVKLGVIQFDNVAKLDEVALDLLLLSGMGSQELSQEHVQKMYITRQLEKEWQQFKVLPYVWQGCLCN